MERVSARTLRRSQESLRGSSVTRATTHRGTPRAKPRCSIGSRWRRTSQRLPMLLGRHAAGSPCRPARYFSGRARNRKRTNCILRGAIPSWWGAGREGLVESGAGIASALGRGGSSIRDRDQSANHGASPAATITCDDGYGPASCVSCGRSSDVPYRSSSFPLRTTPITRAFCQTPQVRPISSHEV